MQPFREDVTLCLSLSHTHTHPLSLSHTHTGMELQPFGEVATLAPAGKSSVNLYVDFGVISIHLYMHMCVYIYMSAR